MRNLLFSPLCIMLIAMAGCGASKHVNRRLGTLETPPIVGGRDLRCFSASSNTFDGRLNLLYEKKLKGSADNPIQYAGPVLAFKSTHNRVLIIDPARGERIAQIKKRRGIILDPVIKDSLLVLVNKSPFGEIEVINLYTGKTISKRRINDIRSGPIIIGDRLVFGTTEGVRALALPDLGDQWSTGPKEMVCTAPVSKGELIYYTAGEGVVRAVASDDGFLIWESDFGAAVVSDLSAGKRLYFGLADGRIISADLETGETIWDHAFGYPVKGGVAESGEYVYTGCTDGSLYCLSMTDGRVIWRFETKGVITAAPIVYEGTVLIGSLDRYLYSVDKTTGRLIDSRKLEGPITFEAAVDEHRIFVTCRKARLYCFEG